MLTAAKALTMTAVDLVHDLSLLLEIKAEVDGRAPN